MSETTSAARTQPASDDLLDALVAAHCPASGRALTDVERNRVRGAFARVLAHHCAEFGRAYKPGGVAEVAAALARGEFAFGRPRADVNLWADVALATLIGLQSAAAAECFRARFGPRVGGWQQRHSRGARYECEEFLADLLLPRERSGPRIESYAGHGPFDGWLKQVYISLCHKRREQVEAAGNPGRGRAADEDAEDRLSQVPAANDGPLERFARLECAEALAPLIRASLDALDARTRAILLMAVVDDVPQRNIAELHGMREYAVTRVKQAAIRQMAEAFRRLAGGGGRLSAGSVDECVQLLLERFP